MVLEETAQKLNRVTGRPLTLQEEGHIYVEYAYGRPRLYVSLERGRRELSGRLEPRELYQFLNGWLRAIEEADRVKRGVDK